MDPGMLKDVIVHTFKRAVGKYQAENDTQKALLVSFKKRIDDSLEDGYRHYDLIVFALHNYVSVCWRERYHVIDVDLLEEDGEGEMVPKEGCDYSKGATGWLRLANHDSAWPEGIANFLRIYGNNITGFASGLKEGFYAVVDAPKDLP